VDSRLRSFLTLFPLVLIAQLFAVLLLIFVIFEILVVLAISTFFFFALAPVLLNNRRVNT
jgi:uncharacterized membrane protein